MDTIYITGWDRLIFSPGSVPECNCKVCGRKMNVHRYQQGGSPNAPIGDTFTCQNSPAEWHKQALVLKVEARDTPSKKVEAMLLEEAQEIIENKSATKTKWNLKR